MIEDKTFEHKPIDELMAIVKRDFSKFDSEGFIDEGRLIKTVMYCNDKLGISIREIREAAIPVNDYRAELPKDFEKLYYVCALNATNTRVVELTNPFDNTFDSDVVYDAHLDRDSIGCVDNYQVVIKKQTKTEVHNYGSWIQLDTDKSSEKFCHLDCPNKKRKGKYTVQIKEDQIHVPFRSGMLYLMYVGMMKDKDGNITFPFHPMITPFYEWTIKEKVLSDMIFNSDSSNITEMWKLADQKRKLAWLDAFNFTTEQSYGEFVNAQRKRELKWYGEWFKYFQ